MNDSRVNTLRNMCKAQDGAAIIIEFDDVPVCDPPGPGITWVNAGDPPGIAVLFDPVHGDLIQPLRVFVVVRVEGKPRVGRHKRDGIFFEEFQPLHSI